MKHRVKTNVHRAMISYKDQYDSHASGLIQEAIQNAADAKVGDLPWRDWRFVIRYDRAARRLTLRDYGTTGMPHCQNCEWGELPHGEICSNRACNWGVFHSFAFLAKEGGMLGSRGQGKSLAVVAGRETIVRTKIAAKPSETMASHWTFDGDDWAWQNVPEEAPGQDWPPGTEIEIRGIGDEVDSQLLDRYSIVNDIQARWYPLLEQGARIRFGFATDQEIQQVPKLRFPATATNPVTGLKITRSRERLEIKRGGEVVGELLNLRISLAENPLEDGDPRIGIALVKNGIQVITRLSRFARRIPPDLQARIVGDVYIPSTQGRAFLESAETPDHRGYKSWDPVFQKVRAVIEAEVSSLVAPYLVPLKEHEIRKEDREKAKRALEVIQKALESVPELKIFGGGEVPPPLEPRIRDHPFVSRIELDKERYARGEKAKVRAIILNPTKKEEAFYRVDFEFRDASLQLLETKMSHPVLPAAADSEPGRKELQEIFELSPTLEPGRQRVIVKLYEAKPEQPPVQVYALGKWLWLEAEPPEIKRPRRPKTGPDDRTFENTLRELHPIDDEAVPPESEIVFTEADAAIWFNLRGVRLAPFWGRVRPPGAEFPILYGLVAEELISKYADHRIADADVETWTPDQVKQFGDELVGLSQRFLRACILSHQT